MFISFTNWSHTILIPSTYLMSFLRLQYSCLGCITRSLWNLLAGQTHGLPQGLYIDELNSFVLIFSRSLCLVPTPCSHLGCLTWFLHWWLGPSGQPISIKYVSTSFYTEELWKLAHRSIIHIWQHEIGTQLEINRDIPVSDTNRDHWPVVDVRRNHMEQNKHSIWLNFYMLSYSYKFFNNFNTDLRAQDFRFGGWDVRVSEVVCLGEEVISWRH